MSYAQTTYIDTPIAGYPGLVANGETSNRISRTVEDGTAVGFGKAVFRSTVAGSDHDHGVTATPSTDLVGITIANGAAPYNAAVGVSADAYPQGSTAAILTQGVIWVVAGASVTDGAAVYVGDGTPDPIGSFTASPTGNIALSGWVFQDTVSSGQPVRIAKR